MGPEVSSRETVLHATLETDRGGSKPNSEAVQAIRAKSRLVSDEAAIQMMREWKPIDEAKAYQLNEQIGFIRGKDGKKVRSHPDDPGAINRFNTAETQTNTIVNFLQNGFDSLNAADQGGVEAAIDAAFDQWSDAKEFFDTYPSAKDRARDLIKKNPHLLLKTRQAFDEFLNDPRNQLTEPDKVIEKREALEQARIQKKAIEDQIKIIKERIAENKTEVDKFEPGKIYGSRLNALDPRVKLHPTTIGTLSNNISLAEQEIQSLDRRRSVKGISAAEFNSYTGQIDTQQYIIDSWRQDIELMNAEIKEHKELLQTYQALKSQRDNYKLELIQAQAIDSGQTNRVKAALDAFEAAKNERILDEQGYTKRLKQVITQATMQVMGERAGAFEKGQKEVVDDLKAKAKSPAESALANALANRWNKRTRQRIFRILPIYRERNRRNDERIERDYHTLMTQGPNRLIENILRAEGLGDLEIQRALNDTRIINNFETLITSTVLRRRWERKKLSKSDGRRMAETAWGVRMIQAGFDKDAFVADQLKKLAEGGKLRGNVAEWITNHSDAEVAAVVAASAGALAAAGIAFGPPAVAAVGSASEAVRGALGIAGAEATKAVSSPVATGLGAAGAEAAQRAATNPGGMLLRPLRKAA